MLENRKFKVINEHVNYYEIQPSFNKQTGDRGANAVGKGVTRVV